MYMTLENNPAIAEAFNIIIRKTVNLHLRSSKNVNCSVPCSSEEVSFSFTDSITATNNQYNWINSEGKDDDKARRGKYTIVVKGAFQ